MLSIQPVAEVILKDHGKGYEGWDPTYRDSRIGRLLKARQGERDTCLRAYPSPPMSGSLPATSAGATAANVTSQGTENRPITSYQHAGHPIPNQDSFAERRGQQPPVMTTTQSYQAEPAAPGPFGFQRPGLHPTRPVSYPQVLSHGVSQPQYGNPAPVVGYPVTARPQTMEHPPYTSPKSQRKTKGHVASACVPSQRPCSRCIANGKEDACIDVQHKKRGRPRLRDDRETRYDPGRLPLPQDIGMRRPMQGYPASGAGLPGYEDPLRRTHQYRVLKSQPSESTGPRYLDRASASDANVHSGPLTIATRPAEPAVYLTMDMEIVKASPSFMDLIGASDLAGRPLPEIVLPGDRDRVLALRGRLKNEQRSEQPNYLPPILDRGHQIIQGLGFSSEDVSRYKLEHHEFWNLIGADGHARPCSVRIGLAKEGSFYFLAAVLSSSQPYAYPSPSPHSRDGSTSYSAAPRTPQSAFTQHTPVSATFDPARHMLGESAPPTRHSGPTSAHLTTNSPGLSSGMPSYSPTPTRPDFPGHSPSYAIPRSHPGPTQHPVGQASYQLPPIRAHQEAANSLAGSGGDPPQPRDERRQDERSSRVDIGGLIDRPEATDGPR
ncbi:c6 zinc finger domain containing protein [Sarocladium implicatum]|nr:c6 zinc finger domain containing protein [Sarocladium implicatum]